jgi:aspartate/methionine/tyrosine aminotransferase
VKLGWIAVDGPDRIACEALQRLEIICDTYLSVSTPVQLAAPELIERGASVRAAIQRRIVRNLEMLSRMLRDHPGTELLNGDGGWSVVLRVPSTISEEHLILDLLEKDDVLVHPGFFFDFPHEAFVVLSLLPPPAVFDEGVRRVLDRVHA